MPTDECIYRVRVVWIDVMFLRQLCSREAVCQSVSLDLGRGRREQRVLKTIFFTGAAAGIMMKVPVHQFVSQADR